MLLLTGIKILTIIKSDNVENPGNQNDRLFLMIDAKTSNLLEVQGQEKDIIECYCGEDEEDGLMLYCEKCTHWQHAECVNFNKFNTPDYYVCPQCRGVILQCECQIEGDFRHALVRCTKCHTYQHKRHAKLGMGEIPYWYVCSKCNKSPNTNHPVNIKPNLAFFPDLSGKVKVKDFNSMPFLPPSGKLLRKLQEQQDKVYPVPLIAEFFNEFRDIFYMAHPFMLFFKNPKMHPKEKCYDAYMFCYYFFQDLAYLLNLPVYTIIDVINHLICIDIYKRPMPRYSRSLPDDFLEMVSEHSDKVDWSERANFELQDKVFEETMNFDIPQLALISSSHGYIVIALQDIKVGQLICEIYGNVVVYEEADYKSTTPSMSLIRIANSEDLYIDCTPYANQQIVTRVHRSFTSNTEARVFRAKVHKRVGLFATKMSILPLQLAPTSDFDGIAIHAGEEVCLPFDITPAYTKMDTDWKFGKLKRQQFDLNIFKVPGVDRRYQIITAPNKQKNSEKAEEDTQEKTTFNELFSNVTPISFQIKRTTVQSAPIKIQSLTPFTHLAKKRIGQVKPEVPQKAQKKVWFTELETSDSFKDPKTKLNSFYDNEPNTFDIEESDFKKKGTPK